MAQASVGLAALRHSPRPWLPSLFASKPHHLFFSTSAAPQPPAHRTRGLRPTGPLPADYDSGDDSDGPRLKKSRNELKREARRAVKWGMELAAFSTPQIKRVLKVAALEREVFDALMLVKRLGPDVREGRRRQFNYIGRLLRAAEPELMEALIQASKDGDDSRLQALSGQKSLSVEDDDVEEETTIYEEEEEEQEVEEDGEESKNHVELASRWFDGLIFKDPSITNEVYSVHNVEFDRQELRRLVRQVQLSQEGLLVDESGVEKDAILTRAKRPLLSFLRFLAKKSLTEQKKLSSSLGAYRIGGWEPLPANLQPILVIPSGIIN